MSIRVFAHDANAAVDRHLCTKNRAEVIEMIRTQQIFLLLKCDDCPGIFAQGMRCERCGGDAGREWAVQFVTISDRTMRGQLSAFLASRPDYDVGEGKTAEQILDLFHSTGDDSSPSITDSEMRANVGEPDGPGAELTPAQILRAQTKLRAWPYVGDELATRVAPVAPGA